MKEKSIAEDIFTSILKNKIYKYMISVSKYVYIDNLDDKVNKYNNIYHRTIKMKPVDINLSTYFDFNKNKWDPKFKIDDILGISKYKTFLQKLTLEIGLEKFLWLKKLKISYRGPMLLMIVMAKKLLEHLTKRNCGKQIKKEFTNEKVIKRKGDKLCVKWKGYDNSFNSWIDKTDIV